MEGEKEEIKINFGILVFLFLFFIVIFAVIFGFKSKSDGLPVVSPTPTQELKIDFGGNKTPNNQNLQNQNMNQGEDINQLKIEDIKVGDGEEALIGKKVTVNYIGSLPDGTKFDSSYDRGIPFSFNLGSGQVIRGWDEGLVGMRVGGKRRLIIPPSLGYGNQAVGSIPPNSTLIFEVELLSVE